MGTDYLSYATSAIQTLTSNWFTPQTPIDWGGGSNFWKTPTIALELIDYMGVTGDTSFITTIENARTTGEFYIGNCGYYDDETCWGRMYIAAYLVFNANSTLKPYAANYLQDAIAVHNDLVAAWDQVCGGGIWWKRNPASYPGNFKASNSTLGSMEIALGLYQATGQQTYLAWAQQCWQWLAQVELIHGGLVFGGLTSDALPDPTNGPVVALQGNPLGPLWSLYAATNDASLLDVAESAAIAGIHQFIWPPIAGWTPQTAILRAGVDPEWNSQPEAVHQAWGGETPFKGIFAGFLGEFAKNLATVSDPAHQAAAKQFGTVLESNADAVWSNFPGGAFGMNWYASQPNYQPDTDQGINASLQYSALALFLAAAKTAA
jgi:hypothetical protein